MTFRHLEAFVQVAARGGFTRAAEALLLTQPTVSGQIKELEEELGVILFDRRPRSVELTEAGERFLVHAREILASRDHLLERAAAYRGLLWGRLVVHGSTVPGEHLLPRLLATFKRDHPKVWVDLRVGDSASVLRCVAAGEASLGVVGEREENLGLEYLPLWTDRIALYTAGHAQEAGVLDLPALRGLPLVLREEGSGTRRAVLQALEAHGIHAADLRVVGEFGSATAVKEAVKSGFGAGFLSDAAVACEVQTGMVRSLPVPEVFPVERRFYAVWDPQRSQPPAVKAFLEHLRRDLG